MERTEIIKALECCNEEHTCNECPYCDNCYNGKVVENALSLIKELTEKVENYRNELGEVRFALAEANNDKKELTEECDAWQKQLISAKEKAGKAYYDLACEVEDLRAENERLRDERDILDISVKDLRGRNKGLQRANESLAKDCDILEDELNECVQIKADTVREMQTEIEARCIKGGIYPAFVKSMIEQIAEELIGE